MAPQTQAGTTNIPDSLVFTPVVQRALPVGPDYRGAISFATGSTPWWPKAAKFTRREPRIWFEQLRSLRNFGRFKVGLVDPELSDVDMKTVADELGPSFLGVEHSLPEQGNAAAVNEQPQGRAATEEDSFRLSAFRREIGRSSMTCTSKVSVALVSLALAVAISVAGFGAEPAPASVSEAPGAAASAGADPPKSTEQEVGPGQLQSLRKERRETLRTLVDAAESKFNSGKATLDSLLRGSELLLEAELDLAETKAERIAVHEKIVANLRQVEKAAQMRCNAGVAPIEESLEAKAARLKAEIQLKCEQTGEAETLATQGVGRTLRLPDSSGKTKVELTADREGGGLILYDDHARPRVTIRADVQGTGPELTFLGEDGSPLILAAGNWSVGHGKVERVVPFILVQDRQGKAVGLVGVQKPE